MNWTPIVTWAVGILASTVVIEVVPIKINPWGWFFKKVLKEANSETNAKIEKIERDLEEHIKSNNQYIQTQAEYKANEERARILRFDDEIKHGVKHSEEHFNDVLGAVDEYEQYCREHPEFPNNKAIMAIKHVKETYEECLKKNSFL